MTKEELNKIAWDFLNSHIGENYEIIELFGIAYDKGFKDGYRKAMEK